MREGLPIIDCEATGKNIVRLMKENKISMYKLQMDLGLQSATNIYAWQSGRHLPSIDYLLKLAKMFNCSVEDILIVKEWKDGN